MLSDAGVPTLESACNAVTVTIACVRNAARYDIAQDSRASSDYCDASV